MRVLLIIPTSNYKYSYPVYLASSDFPVGFAYLASALRSAGHEVFGLNPNNDPGYSSAPEMLHAKISQSLKESRPELIGVGGLCTDFKFLKDAIQIIRTLAADVPIVCGGGIINNDAEFVFKTLRPDFCVIGEGEEVLVQLVGMLENNKRDYEQIDNLGYWQGGVPQFTRQNFDYIDLDKRRFPDYAPFGIDEMLDDYSMAARYLYRYTRPNSRLMTIVTARGCPFNCSFCVHQGGPKYRARSVENIIQEIKSLYERYRFNVLIILDELFAVNKQRLKEFCVALINAREACGWDFDWCFQAHASASFDQESLGLAKKAGCYFFSYGLESASPKVLASMNKKTKPSQIAEVIEIADAQSVGFGGNFIFGDIAETTETISETMDFFSRYCLDSHIYLSPVQPYPGSKLFEDCIERGIISDKREFYEHTDEGIINMTSIPDELWFPWMEKTESFKASFPWTRSTYAFRYSQELETTKNPIVAHSGKLIWRVWAKCPYCTKEIYYREPLGIIRDSFFVTLSRLFMRVIEVYRQERKLSKFLRRLIKKIVPFSLYSKYSKHYLFKLLESLETGSERTPLSFVTGCPHCNKRIWINIPVTDRALNVPHTIK